MVDFMYRLTSLLFFEILLCYINVRSSAIFSLFFGDIYLSLGIFVLLSTASKVFCGKFLKAFVILLTILLSIKSSVASAVFWFAFLKQF